MAPKECKVSAWPRPWPADVRKISYVLCRQQLSDDPPGHPIDPREKPYVAMQTRSVDWPQRSRPGESCRHVPALEPRIKPLPREHECCTPERICRPIAQTEPSRAASALENAAHPMTHPSAHDDARKRGEWSELGRRLRQPRRPGGETAIRTLGLFGQAFGCREACPSRQSPDRSSRGVLSCRTHVPARAPGSRTPAIGLECRV